MSVLPDFNPLAIERSPEERHRAEVNGFIHATKPEGLAFRIQPPARLQTVKEKPLVSDEQVNVFVAMMTERDRISRGVK